MRRWRLALPVLGLPALLLGSAGATPAMRATNIPCTAPKSATAPPVSTSACTGVRPGADIRTPIGICTAGFLFQGSDGRRYLSTAGHCFLAAEGEQTWSPAKAPLTKDPSGKVIGRAVYAQNHTVNNQVVDDFALVLLDKLVASDPAVCTFGGPTRVNMSIDDEFYLVHHVGQSIGLGNYLPARSAYVTRGLARPDYVYAWAAAGFGDSGGPVTDDTGQAIGILTQITYGPEGTVGINRLTPRVQRASAALKLTLKLLTAPAL